MFEKTEINDKSNRGWPIWKSRLPKRKKIIFIKFDNLAASAGADDRDAELDDARTGAGEREEEEAVNFRKLQGTEFSSSRCVPSGKFALAYLCQLSQLTHILLLPMPLFDLLE